MRKLAFTLAILLLAFAGSASAQQEPWANKLFGNKTTHDFGVVARGATLKYTFPIRNIYAEPLTITDVRVSCGCLTATPSKKTINPQEETTLDITMDARKFSGPKSIKVYVTVGPKYISTAVLEVTANARGDVVLNPGELNFGVVMQGQQPVQTLDVEYAGFLNFQLVQVQKPGDAPFEVSVQELYRKPPAGGQPGRVGYRLTAKLNADAPGGTFKNDLVLKTNDQQGDSLIVTVEGNVQSALSAAPMSLNLGAVEVGATKTFKVQVSGNRPFLITAIKCDSKEISFDLPAAAAQMHFVTMRCQPTAAGAFVRQITIVTDLDKGASVTITVQGDAAK
jgi:hypothetical protein